MKKKNEKARHFWRRVATWLSVLVVFCTTYALILPAVTLTAPTYSCNLEEHQHTADCYEEVVEERPVASEQPNETENEDDFTDFNDAQTLNDENETGSKDANSTSTDQTKQETVNVIRKVLKCKKPEHHHTAQCKESSEEIIKNLPTTTNIPSEEELSNDLNTRALQIAQSQLSYQPDLNNCLKLYDENNSDNQKTLYWNPYGALANDPYNQNTDLAASFVNFVLHYTDSSLDWSLSPQGWINHVNSQPDETAWQSTSLESAQPGAIVFFEKETAEPQTELDENNHGNETVSGLGDETGNTDSNVDANGNSTPALSDGNGFDDESANEDQISPYSENNPTDLEEIQTESGLIDLQSQDTLDQQPTIQDELESNDETSSAQSVDVTDLEVGFLAAKFADETNTDTWNENLPQQVSVITTGSESKAIQRDIDQNRIRYAYQIKSDYKSNSQNASTTEEKSEEKETTENSDDNEDDSKKEDSDESGSNQLTNDSYPKETTESDTNENKLNSENDHNKTNANGSSDTQTAQNSVQQKTEQNSVSTNTVQIEENKATDLKNPVIQKAGTKALAVDPLTVKYDINLPKDTEFTQDVYGLKYTKPSVIEASVQITSDSLVLPEPSDYEYRVVSGSSKENRAFVHYFKGWQIGNDTSKIYSPGESVTYDILSKNKDSSSWGERSNTVTIKAVWYHDMQHKSSDTAIFSVNLNVNADTDYSRSYADTSNDNWVDAVYSTAVIEADGKNIPRSNNSQYQDVASDQKNTIPYTDENGQKHQTPNTTYAATFIAYQSPGTYFHATQKYKEIRWNNTTDFSQKATENAKYTYTIEQDNLTSTPQGAHDQIVNLARTDGVNSSFVYTAAMLQDVGPTLYTSTGGYTLRIGSVPTNDQILKQLQSYQKKATDSTKKIKYGNGKEVATEDLTPENFTVIWHVFKLNLNDKFWHIDGKLVQRNSYITITKYFDDDGNSEAVQAIKDGKYSIDVYDNVASGNAIKQNLAKTLILSDTGSQSPAKNELTSSSDEKEVKALKIDENTYRWTIPVRSNETYTFKEKNFIYSKNGSNIVTLAQYNTQNINGIEDKDNLSELSGLVTYPGNGTNSDKGVSIYTQSFSEYSDESSYQRINFLNSYFDTTTLPIYKVDNLSSTTGGGNLLPNAKFKLVREDGEQFDLYQRTVEGGSRKGIYLYPAAVNESPTDDESINSELVQLEDNTFETGNAPVFLKNFKSSKFAGKYVLTEVEAPEGYQQIKEPIRFNVDESGTVTLQGSHASVDWVTASDSSGKDALALRIKNTAETMNVTVTKEWADQNDQGTKITVQLLQSLVDPKQSTDGKPQGSPVGTEVEITKSPTGTWSHKWENLPMYIGGQKVYYYLREMSIVDSKNNTYNYMPSLESTDGFANYIVNYEYLGRTTTSEQTTASWKITNQKDPGGVNLFKVDQDGKGLAGAIFGLYSQNPSADENINLIQTVESNSSTGLIHIPNLDDGIYYLKEIEAPSGYILDQETIYILKVEGKLNGNPQYTLTTKNESSEGAIDLNLRIINQKITMNLSVTKVAKNGQGEEGEITLQGAQFKFIKFTDKNFNVQVDSGRYDSNAIYTSDENGIIAIPDLEEGYYRLQEVKAPDGYYLPTSTFDFYVSYDTTTKQLILQEVGTRDSAVFELHAPTFDGENSNKKYSLSVINTTGQKLPDTGGEGTNLYTSGGILLLAASCLLYMFSKKQSYGKGEQ